MAPSWPDKTVLAKLGSGAFKSQTRAVLSRPTVTNHFPSGLILAASQRLDCQEAAWHPVQPVLQRHHALAWVLGAPLTYAGVRHMMLAR